MIFHSLRDKERLVMIGLMTGTSMDGLDICVVDVGFSSESCNVELLASESISYTEEIRKGVTNCLKGDVEEISRTHFNLGRFMAVQTKNFLKSQDIDLVDAVGMHGQTVHHVSGEASLQIGEPSFLAQELKVPVISDFRAADIAAGGTGAPLIPIVDRWLFQQADVAIICLNLGGVANVSFIPPRNLDKPVLGFDTGPGMALMDEAMVTLVGENFDKDGAICLSGVPNERDVDRWLNHPFINESPPKSTGRDIFGSTWIKENISDLSLVDPNDLMATLSFFTARSVAVNCSRFLPLHLVQKVVVSGGGVYNKAVMKYLEKEFSPIVVRSSHDYGFDPFIKEAIGFAILGAANLKEIPANLPSVTGATEKVILGKVTV